MGKIGNENTVSLNDVRVNFTVKKTQSSEDNISDINIYNLSKETRELFTDTSNLAVLQAGYSENEGLRTIAVGNIISFNVEKNKADIITKIKLGDGSSKMQESTISKGYAEGTLAQTVLNDVLANIGLPVNESNKLKAKFKEKPVKFLRGLNLIGISKDALNVVSKKLGFQWSVQDGVLNLIELDGVSDKQIAFFDENSGLIGSPQRKSEGEQSNKKDGYEIRTLLMPEIQPNDKVSFESLEVKKALYKVDSIEHKGDNYGQIWNSTMFLIEYAK